MTDRAQWLADRKQGVGGSDVASLLNVGYGCTRRLFYDKVGIPEDYPFDGNKATRLGTVLEPYFAEEYQRETMRSTRWYRNAFGNQCVPQVRSNIDRSVHIGSGEDNPGVLEIKSVSRGVFYTIKREGLPEDYILQLQHGMLATGWSWGAYCIGNRDSGEILPWDVQRNEEICQRILAEVPKFWELVERAKCSCSPNAHEPCDICLMGVESVAPDRLEPDDRRCQSCQWRKTCQGNALIQIDTGDIQQAEELRPLLAEYDTRKELFAQAESLLGETTAQLKSDLGDRQAVKVGDRKVYFRPQAGRVLYDGKKLYEAYKQARLAILAAQKIGFGQAMDIIDALSGMPLAEPESFVDQSKPSRPLRIF